MKPEEMNSELYALWQNSGWTAEEFLCEAKLAVLKRTKRLKICYHGTDAETADIIAEKGFKPGTYFGEHLEDALGFGGPYVFEVCFPQDTTSVSGWQFTIEERVPVDRIVRLKHIEIKETLYDDKELGKRIFESNLEGRKRGGE